MTLSGAGPLAPSDVGGDAGARKPRRDDELEVALERIDARGRAVGTALWQGLEYRVAVRGLPGRRVLARVLSRRRERIEATVLTELAPSPAAVTPRCPHVRSCGGCAFQDLAYGAQLVELRALVEDAFRVRGLLSAAEVEPVIGAPGLRGPWAYRNKMEFAFASRRWREPGEVPSTGEPELALGLHARGSYGKVVDVRSCAIQHERFDPILATARRLALERGLSAWDVASQRGCLRYLVLRAGVRTGEILVNLVTSSDSPELVEPWVRELAARHPEITTFVWSVNSGPAGVAIGETERVLVGSGAIREECLGLRFEISARSFFQTNTEQAEVLFRIVREEARLTGAEVVWDLYCGTGALALVLAGGARAVLGLEQVPAAVADARRNARINGIGNAEFLEGDVLGRLEDHLARAHGSAACSAPLGPSPDVCVVDPPRAGLHARVPRLLCRIGPRRIVYVSCNPEAGARDVAAFVTGGYRVGRIRPIAQFPHTPHVECVIGLSR